MCYTSGKTCAPPRGFPARPRASRADLFFLMPEPARILAVFSTLDRGGAETMFMELYRHVDRSRLQFDFVKHTPEPCAYEPEIAALGGRVYTAPAYRVVNHLSYLRWWRRFLREHEELRVVHGHYFTVASVFLEEARRRHRVTIAHAHSTKVPMPKKPRSRLKALAQLSLIKRLENCSDYRFACSKEAGEWLFPTRGYTLLHNAIDTARFLFSQEDRESARRELGISRGAPVIGTVGRLDAQKNPRGIAEIFAAFHEREPRARFLWVGDGVRLADTREYIARLGLTDAFLFTGVRADVPRLLAAMDVFLLPSFFEGLSVATVEAQAEGLPTLVNDPLPHEVALTPLCEFLPESDRARWAERIAAHLASPAPRAAASRAAVEQICAAGYDISATSAYMQDFYLRAVRENLAENPGAVSSR